ncbi:MAG TPA: acyl-CoA dehydrogenase [Acidimicrobiales bacterium]|nr:acyl-CoA dehydrogenase [Acidimicrobiales bacterium]
MPIGIAQEHEELRRTLRRWLEARCGREVPRALLDAESESLPPFWEELASQGWLGIAAPEECGGQGFGFMELAVVTEELARAMAPGPVVPTLVAAALVSAVADATQLKQLVAPMVDGTAPTALALPGSGVLEASFEPDGSLRLSGVLSPVLCATTARRLLAPAVAPGGAPWGEGPSPSGEGSPVRAETWCVVDLDAGGVSVEQLASLDLTRRLGKVSLSGVAVAPEMQLPALAGTRVRHVALAVAAAECAGGARWCLETATSHALDRRQFGRLIGQFQAVKHRLADMLVSVEQTTALAWDAAQAMDRPDPSQGALAACLAGSLGLDAYVECAKDCIQLLGGMGFTWEHDAHLHLRRAFSLRQLLGGTDELRLEAARSALGGSRRGLEVELPEEAEELRTRIAPIVAEVAAVHGPERRRLLVEARLIAPHWPEPYGRSSGPIEQLVIDQELAAAGVQRPNLAVGAWALPTIIAHGTAEQTERWVGPTLAGDLVWCQLFSEPGAGSDLASLSTRATRAEGGWVLDGQKVWTSMAARADFGICLARTDPDAPKHEGITYFVVDMRSPGIEVRPLREITGDALFNEVFLDSVFVPDDCVVGPVDGGWRLARTTLANERVSMSSGATFGFGIEWILGTLAGTRAGDDPVVLERLGGLVAEASSVALLGARTTLRSVSGVEPGPEASVRKLLGAEHEQRVQELGLVLLGPEGATTEAEAGRWSRGFLSTRCLTIAGGTSEVQRNVIGERILGLPRDPEPGA